MQRNISKFLKVAPSRTVKVNNQNCGQLGRSKHFVCLTAPSEKAKLKKKKKKKKKKKYLAKQ